MSKHKQDFKTWDQYVAEASIDPFVIKAGDESIEVDNPTGARLLQITRGLRSGDLELILVALCGDAWPQVEALMEGAPHGVLPALVEDMMDHFDLYDEVTLIGPGGGKVTSSRPREIQSLLSKGYRVAGESDASRG